MKLREITVITYDGYKAAEHPLRFILNGHTYQVTEIIDRWYEGSAAPGEVYLIYFKVKADDGRIYLLRYNGLFDAWAILEPEE